MCGHLDCPVQQLCMCHKSELDASEVFQRPSYIFSFLKLLLAVSAFKNCPHVLWFTCGRCKYKVCDNTGDCPVLNPSLTLTFCC